MLETIIVLLVVGLDQLVKYLTDLYLMPLGTSVHLWGGVFHLTSAHNTGAAFGMLSSGTWLLIVFSSIAALLLAWVLVKFRPRLHTFMRITLALILAGALGNLIDRVVLGYVRDMFEFAFINFAIFNVADTAVSIGAALLALDVFFGKGRQVVESLDAKPIKAGEAGKEQSAEENADETAADMEPEQSTEEHEGQK